MILNNNQYDTMMSDYQNIRMANYQLQQDRIQEIYSISPKYEELNNTLISLRIQLAVMKLSDNDPTAINAINELICTITSDKLRILQELGYPQNYLDDIHNCPKCQDMGYIGEAKCECLIERTKEILFNLSNLKDRLQQENFHNLNESYYSGDDLVNFNNIVDRCHKFIANFDTTFSNLFLYGRVGCGKSFLSSCIAYDLINTGKSVLYYSATSLFDTLSKLSFDHSARAELDNLNDYLISCDLLIIDDLGTELTNSFTSSRLFSCLNDRLQYARPTIISTNLSLPEMQSRYSDRIFSRIIGNYEVYKMTGPDIRLIKKTGRNKTI